MDQHAPQVAVAAFTDVSESPVAAARVFARRQPDPARKLAPAVERMNVTDRADQGGRPQQADAGHGLQQRADRVGGGQLPQLAVELGDAVLQRADFLLHAGQHAPERSGQLRPPTPAALEPPARLSSHRAADAGHVLQQTPQGIDARRARRHPLLADPVQPDQGLLLRPLDRHGGNPLHARCVHQRLGIGAVGLVPADERTHVVGRQQRHPVPVLLSEAPPVVRRAARFHHDPARPALRQKAHERRPAKPLPLGDLAALVRHRHLEHALCEIHRHCRTLHVAANPRTWAECNLWAAWILGEMCREGRFGGLAPRRQMRALEAALFMIGYELPTSA